MPWHTYQIWNMDQFFPQNHTEEITYWYSLDIVDFFTMRCLKLL